MDEEKIETTAQRDKRWEEMWAMKSLRAKVSWYTWSSPVGLGLVLIAVGVLLWLLHLANIIH